MRRHTIFILALAAGFLGVGEAPALTFLELSTGDDAFVPDARSVASSPRSTRSRPTP